MHLGHSYKQQPPSGRFDAIVIGSGIGGLTVAAMLSRHGKKRVLVLERHYRIGGYTHTFTRPGYEWDVGVHYIGQVGEHGALRSVFDKLSDGRIRWAKLPEVYDRVELGARGYDLVAGTQNFIETLGKAFPAEKGAIAKYVELVKSTAKKGSMFFMTRGLPSLVSAVAAPLAKRGYAELAARTTRDVLLELTKNEELLAVLTGQYGDYGLPPSRSSFAMHASLVAHYLGGGYYPVGGASVIAAGIAPLIEEHGGHLATNAEVESVIVEQGIAVGVRLADGSEQRAPLVISDAGVANTFGRLVPEAHRPAAWTKALSSVPPSVSYVCLYLGFKSTDAELGLTGTNLWLYPDEKHDENVARFEADPEAPFPMMYLSFPSAKDPDFARRFPGRATIDAITMAKWEWFSKWQGTKWRKRGAEYDAVKARWTERMLEVLFKRLPQLKGRVDVAELSTPLTTARFASHPRGELYGLDHTPGRYELPLRAKTPLPGLLLTGADLATCGVAGGALGGLITAGALLGPGPVMDMLKRA
ncbi:MAG: NAD(P)/FAD-dependent oxidoreductase [Myxococcaceae bacterium]|nr:NAD(P)/FAD-dependent oxidoreductase [Myxococcaceae bacterium]